MTDYIDRGKLIAALEMEKRARNKGCPRQAYRFEHIIGHIKTFQSEDMVPRSQYELVARERDAAVAQMKDRGYSFTEKLCRVVFCRDCSHCREKDMFGMKKVLECQRIDRAVDPGHWCSYGVRRERDG